MKPKNFLSKIQKRVSKQKFSKSFAQSGEDLILGTLFAADKKGTYVDVGANDPYFQSNTQHFYNRGWNGINIDANIDSIKKLNKVRKRDINIEALISDSEQVFDYYYYETSAYNGCVKRDHVPSRLLFTKKIEGKSLTSILLKYKVKNINFLSIDAEGFDLNVLKSLDLNLIRPQVILIESFAKNIDEDLNSDISKHLKAFNYIYYCRSVTNSFYLSAEFHEKRFL